MEAEEIEDAGVERENVGDRAKEILKQSKLQTILHVHKTFTDEIASRAGECEENSKPTYKRRGENTITPPKVPKVLTFCTTNH